jgi:PAS domain S-box-containing protein
MNLKSTEDIKILVIEDNIGDFILIKDYVEEQVEFPKIINAKSYSEAINFLKDDACFFDVVLLDLTLPDKGGESLITDIISFCPNTPVIILTGYANVEFSLKSLALKATDYLLKDDINSSSLYKSIKYNIERKKTNLKLEESETRYSNLFQLSPQPMWILDIETLSFIQVNDAAINQYGYSEVEFLQLQLPDILCNKYDFTDYGNKYKHFINNPNVYKGRFKHKKKSKETIEVDIYSALITINNKQCESAIAIDVTEKIMTELKITKAIIKTQEDERYEIGTELHDNVCQILASSQLSLEMLKDYVPQESTIWLNKSREFINLALEEIRSISHRLAPSFFDFTTIEETFKELLDTFNIEKKYEIKFNIDFSKMQGHINSDMQLNLYRILQEQLRNISKYANAKKITIESSLNKSEFKMQIIDDGIGFDFLSTKKGIGLANIRRRAELFSGRMDVESSIGNGCKLIITIPLQP